MLPASGTIVPLVTPFTSDDRVDRAAIARVVSFILDEGADAVMPTALTGEGPLLTPDETVEIWEATFEQVGGRVPVAPAVISTTTRQTVRLAERAHALGADALLVAPIVPELYAGRSRADVVRFFRSVSDATPLPLIAFNYPSLTGVDLTPDVLSELAAVEHVRYVKESTGDSRRVHAIHRQCGDRIEVICGSPNAAYESLTLGCRLWITGIMNVVPRQSREMLRAIDAGDLAAARQAYYTDVLPLVDRMFSSSNPTGIIKAGLRARGVEVGVPRSPGSDVSDDDRRWLRAFTDSLVRAARQSPLP
jgi:4-hydroxy-tetrahydrodipicolinate synthase